MRYVEAVTEFDTSPRPHVFMAGGITNCPDWQQELRTLLEDVPHGTLLNPRRANFPIGDPDAAQEQIAWEHRALWQADVFSMWFSVGSVQPICMFELGAHLSRWRLIAGCPYPHKAVLKAVAIGADPDYVRLQDVIIQTALIDPSLAITATLEQHCHAITDAVVTCLEQGTQ